MFSTFNLFVLSLKATDGTSNRPDSFRPFPLERGEPWQNTQIIRIDEEQDILCPVCGVTILDSEELHQQPSCPHVRFIYANGEAFEYCDPELEALLAEEEAKADEDDEFFDTWDALRRHCGRATYPGADRGLDGVRACFIYRLDRNSHRDFRGGLLLASDRGPRVQVLKPSEYGLSTDLDYVEREWTLKQMVLW